MSTPKVEKVIIKNDAKVLLRLITSIANLVKRPSPSLVTKTFTGSSGRDVKKHKLDELQLHGVGTKFSVRDVEYIIHMLVMKFR